MTIRRESAINRRLARCNESSMKLFITLIVVLVIREIHGDYLMGGHLDNKEDQVSSTMVRRSDDENSRRTSVVSSRTSSLEDGDFDLELDLLGADQSGQDSKRTNGEVSSSDDAKSSIIDESETAPRYRVPPYAFNGGQPFSLEKDPITGQIDFEKAPPLKALEYTVDTSIEAEDTITTTDATTSVDLKNQRDDSSLGPNEINPYSPSFHDFLNLPVRYTYDKNSDKYPLISNSYANTKVQSGSNSYNTHNHKKYHEAVKAGVDIQTLYVQPSRKTYAQSMMKSTTTSRPTTIRLTTTTSTTTTTTEAPRVTPSTTKMTTPPTTTTTKRNYTRYPVVTTWKPQQRPSATGIYGVYTDYEATLPIERLQTGETKKPTTTEKPIIAPTSPRPKPEPPKTNEDEYEDGYEDYDRILQIAGRPPSSNEDQQNNESDYTYGSFDFLGDSRPVVEAQTSAETTSGTTPTSIVYASDMTTNTLAPTTTAAIKFPDSKDDAVSEVTRVQEEKRVTSMPLDTIDNDRYRPPTLSNANNGFGKIDNSIPSNNVVFHNNRPMVTDHYYGIPEMGASSGGIVVKSTSNVVVPPGQDTVSFVLGNRQSVGSVSDAGQDFYGVHASNDRVQGSFINVGNSRPIVQTDNFSGQMIVSAGIGVGSNPIGSYHQRPSTNVNNYDHAVVTVGMPTVDIVNPGESGTTINANKNNDSSTNSLDTLAQKWWSSTSSVKQSQHNDNQRVPADSGNQNYGHRVVFPDDNVNVNGNGGIIVGDESIETQRPIEEHVIVVHESEIGNANGIRLDLSSQSTSTNGPTNLHHYETTTQRLTGINEDIGLPELSESLTPPAERPNILPSGIHNSQRPSAPYNYYHHQSSHSSNSRPNDYQRPQRLPISQSPSSTSNGFKRRPPPPPPSIEQNLPNILPQFRPNAKTSHGHNRGETIGTIPAGSLPPYGNTRIRRPSPSHHNHNHHHQQHHHRSPPSTSRRPVGPPHLQRLNPPPLPPPPSSQRLPTPASLIASPNLGATNQHDSTLQNNENLVRLGGPNRLHKVTIGGATTSLNIDERHHQSPGFVVTPIKSRLEDDDLERFSAEPPPRPPYFTKRTTNEQVSDGIPRIATLQMIQQHGGPRDDEISGVRPNLPPPYRFGQNENSPNRQDTRDTSDNNKDDSSGTDANRRGDSDDDKSEELVQADEPGRGGYGDSLDSPVYVVYPVKGALDIRPDSHKHDDADDASVVLGKYGSQRPLPPDTLLQDSDDNESSIRESLYRPSSIVSSTFTDTLTPQLASDFPYPLERPDPAMFESQSGEKPLLVPSEHQKNGPRPGNTEEKINDGESDGRGDVIVHDVDGDASVNVIPYLQDHVPFTLKENAGIISATLHRFTGNSQNLGSSTPIAYVYTPTTRSPVRRTDDLYVNANFDRGPVLLPSQRPSSSSSSAPSPQSFMAPFVASASAEAPTKNGWSVVMMGQPSNDEKSTVDRRRHDTDSRDNMDKDASEAENENKTDSSVVNDTVADSDKKSDTETSKTEISDAQTEKSEFDVVNFTPQLFGGFKPIFEFLSDTETDPNLGDKVSRDDVAIAERPRSSDVPV